MKKIFSILALLTTLSFPTTAAIAAKDLPSELYGDWSLNLSTKEPAWFKLENKEGTPKVYMRVHVLRPGPHKISTIDQQRVIFPIKIKRELNDGPQTFNYLVNVGIENGKLKGFMTNNTLKAPYNKITFSGKKYPPMPKRPDLSKVKFGPAVSLFNGKDLSGWELYNPKKINGWSAKNGHLINTTPKTDFSSTGVYGNLQTKEVFNDFKLHIEFKLDENSNSGVYLRGMYEAQVVSEHPKMQGIQGIGAIFSKIKPTSNAGKGPGEWQTYDLTLVDRHITVVLNGTKVIDNQPIDGPTGGAIHTDPTTPGPIFLQGDHTSIMYRNIYLEPVIN